MSIRLFELANQLGIETSRLMEEADGYGYNPDPFAEVDDVLAATLSKLFKGKRPLERNIDKLQVAGFKAFSNLWPQTVELAPLTLIFGPNSGGKSSILHALLYAHHATTTGQIDIQHPVLSGKLIDLGGLKTSLYQRNPDNNIHLSFDLPGLGFTENIAEKYNCHLTLRFGLERHREDNNQRNLEREDNLIFVPCLRGYYLQAGDERILTVLQDFNTKTYVTGRGLRVIESNFNHPLLGTMLKSIAEAAAFKMSGQQDSLKIAAEELMRTLLVKTPHLLPTEVEVRTWVKENISGTNLNGVSVDPEAWAMVKNWLPQLVTSLFRVINQQVEGFLNSFIYLAPIRFQPDRWFTMRELRSDSWQAGGGAAWDIIRNSPETREKLNDLLGTMAQNNGKSFVRYEVRTESAYFEKLIENQVEQTASNFISNLWNEHEEKRRSQDPDDLLQLYAPFDDIDVKDLSQKTMAALKNSQSGESLNSIFLVDMRNKTRVSLQDVGVGVSQSLPLMIHALHEENKTIIIEQPEVHIHPRLQADLGDVFIQSALGPQQNRMILETHSEHLILRLLRRIRESSENDPNYPANLPKIRPEDVSVLYVEPSANGSLIKKLRITPDGDFADNWPDGFFTEREKELF